jgi:hypothetical protein
MVDRLSTIGCLLGCAVAWLLFWIWPKLANNVSHFFNPRQNKEALFLVLWLAADLCGARMGGRYYPHYFLPSLLGLVLVSCLAIDVLAKMIVPAKYSQLLIWIILLPIGCAALKGQIDFYHSVSGNPPDEWKQAALFIKDHKRPDDVIFTWQFRPGIYRLAESHTLTRWDSAHYINDFPEAHKSIGDELIAELRANPPNFIVSDCKEDPFNTEDTVKRQFVDLLRSKYHLVYRTGETCVSERLAPTSSDQVQPSGTMSNPVQTHHEQS